jgi:nucleotide sugar dehydrogenase
VAATLGDEVLVVGLGYVGLPLAMRAVEVGHHVVGFDVDEERVKQLLCGESYIEDVPSDRVLAAVSSGRFTPITTADSITGFDVAVIAVPTPLRDGDPDLRHVTDAAVAIARHLRLGATVVLESTTQVPWRSWLHRLSRAAAGLRRASTSISVTARSGWTPATQHGICGVHQRSSLV